ncbi:MAG TPA: hypothetical protein VM940_07820 [Chthoniobacterales bacterium]|jgi:hypothetical protein|nr:hypothetical protein [Chthoniobacterales bacterium]
MKWQKRGLVYAPSGEKSWARSHAYIPTPDLLNEDVLRIYFTALDEQKLGRIGYVDLDANDPTRVIAESKDPILDLGPLGAFDDSGVTPSCVLNVNGKKYLYYVGWQRCERVPYMIFVGLAISDDGVHFKRASSTPILDRTNSEPFLRSSNSVIYDQDRFKTWYVSALSWIHVNDLPIPTYVIRYAESANGIDWQSRDEPAVAFKNKDEYGLGRPWVFKDHESYKIWYSIRSRVAPYCIGYAESSDGIHWTRKDEEVGIDRSTEGWDSEMICFPCVLPIRERLRMFYNGNRHGSTGFGYAVSDP